MPDTRQKRTPSHIRTIQMIAGLAMLVVIIAAAIMYLSQPQHSTAEEAQLAYLEGRYQESADAFTEAIIADSDNAEYYVGRAFAYLQLEEGRLAKSDFEYAIALAPDSTDTRPYEHLGNIAIIEQDYELALDYFNRIIELADEGSTTAAEAYYNQGHVFVRLDDNAAALESFRTATEYDPTVAHYFQRLGDTYYLLGQTGEALNAYEQYFALEQPDNIVDYVQERVQELRGNN